MVDEGRELSACTAPGDPPRPRLRLLRAFDRLHVLALLV
jgi:hypothetical protein